MGSSQYLVGASGLNLISGEPSSRALALHAWSFRSEPTSWQRCALAQHTLTSDALQRGPLHSAVRSFTFPSGRAAGVLVVEVADEAGAHARSVLDIGPDIAAVPTGAGRLAARLQVAAPVAGVPHAKVDAAVLELNGLRGRTALGRRALLAAAVLRGALVAFALAANRAAR